MHLSLEHVDACLPITTLKALDLRDGLILQGQGPYARLVHEGSGKLLAELKTFRRNNIHGFITLGQGLNDGRESVRLIAWGGQSLRVFCLVYAGDGEMPGAWLTAASAECLAPDWILAGCASSVEDAATAYMVTAHNALLGLHVVNADSSYENAIHLQQLVTGVKSILYSADAIAVSASHILITAGTVFGEIIVWSCFVDEPESLSSNALGSIHHFFTGHEGSIFGVRISPEIPFLHGDRSGRLLASCSDDRTVRIWDISDCERTSREDPSAYATDGFELRSTGFGVGAADEQNTISESCIAKAFGHIARIWSVHFLPTVVAGQRRVGLISRGEDATCLLWDLSWEQSTENFRLKETDSFHHHAGKHIWSLDMRSNDRATVVYTGGNDGAIRTFRVGKEEEQSAPETNASDSDVALKTFAFVSPDCFIATSYKGEIQIGSASSEDPSTKPHISRETVSTEDDLRSFSILAGIPRRELALVGNGKGLIRLYNHSTKSLSPIAQTDRRPLGLFALELDNDASNETLSFVTSYGILDRVNLFMVTGWQSAEQHVDNITLNLPSSFEVTCATFLCGGLYVALGSKFGGIAIYATSTGEALDPLMTFRRVHGEAGTNRIMPFWSEHREDSTTLEYILTCGRDGNYCVHEMEFTATSSPIHLQTVHRSTTSMGQDVSGAYFDHSSQDLMLYGFRGKEFVLWNETTQTELVRAECGGARRSWAFQPSDHGANGLFLWNQASAFNTLRIHPNSNRPLRFGGHGREVKSMESFNAVDGEERFFATGAEDTAVRIFTTIPEKDSPWGAFKCERVLKKHRAGLQQVSWSHDGKFLFTSAGYEEFLVWRIQSIPRFGIAAIHVASNPEDDVNSDLRVTSFDILDVKEGDGSAFLICQTFSNSTIKIFHYSPSNPNFTLLAKGTYTSNCLTQAQWLLKDSSLSLITTSTDGHFTLWNLTSTLSPFYNITSSTFSTTQPLQQIQPAQISCENRYQIHQNSIKSMQLAHLSDTSDLLLSGSDDNSLSLSLLDANPESTKVTTISIPDAHAASVTTIKVLHHQQDNIIFASSGNDHRVKIWSVDVDLDGIVPDAMTVRCLSDMYSCIADISSLDVIRGDELKLLVCGVGMELIQVHRQ